MALMFNGRPNKYYLDRGDCRSLTISQLRAYKYNNQFLMSVFTNLGETNGENPEDALGMKLPCILENQLPKSDSETGLSSHNLGAKLNFLIRALKNPEERKKFKNSFFFQLIEVLRRGSINYDDMWASYRLTSRCPDLYKEQQPITIAVVFHSKNNDYPIGINFSKLIDCLIGTDKNGNYFIRTDFDKFSPTAREMNQACGEYLKMIKSTPSFRSYCEKDDGNLSSIY